jgi:hypothetical protein
MYNSVSHVQEVIAIGGELLCFHCNVQEFADDLTKILSQMDRGQANINHKELLCFQSYTDDSPT